MALSGKPKRDIYGYMSYGEQALERIDVNLKILRNMIDACEPEAIGQVKEIAQLIKSKRITGDISSWDFRVLNNELDDEIERFLNRCTCIIA